MPSNAGKKKRRNANRKNSTSGQETNRPPAEPSPVKKEATPLEVSDCEEGKTAEIEQSPVILQPVESPKLVEEVVDPVEEKKELPEEKEEIQVSKPKKPKSPPKPFQTIDLDVEAEKKPVEKTPSPKAAKQPTLEPVKEVAEFHFAKETDSSTTSTLKAPVQFDSSQLSVTATNANLIKKKSTEAEVDKVVNSVSEEFAKATISEGSDEITPIRPPRKSSKTTTPLAPLQQPSTRSSPAPTKNPEMVSTNRKRNLSISYNKGQVVRRLEPPSANIVSSVAGLVHDAMPKSQSNVSILPQIEKAEWVQISQVEKAGSPGSTMNVIIIGLVRGFQIWTVNENGEVEEVLSMRQGPIRACKILSSNLPVPNGVIDPFDGKRPLMALVDGFSHSPDHQYCSVFIMSLATGKEEKRFNFDEAVLAINQSTEYLAVSLSKEIHVFDQLTLSPVRKIKVKAQPDFSAPASSLYGQSIAFADLKLNSDYQSAGGLGTEVETSGDYTNQIMSTMKFISRSVTETMTSGASSQKKNLGVVTVLDLHTPKGDDIADSIVCHWLAHDDSDISYMTWTPDGRLLLTADASATVFNVFLVQPHSFSSSFAAVQHLYKLSRGSTSAKITSTSFSSDSRWLSVSTNHGTCHIFAICPYGGKPNQRTHSSYFVNKVSRFHRSAGLTDDVEVVASHRSRTVSGTNNKNREHPVLASDRIMARAACNPRVGSAPPPIKLYSIAKIQEEKYTAENLAAWASDLSGATLVGSSQSQVKKRLDLPKTSIAFASKSSAVDTSSLNLLVSRVDPNGGAIVWEYQLDPYGAVMQNGSLKNSEEEPKLLTKPVSYWSLHRTKNNTEMHAPMPTANPLMSFVSEMSSSTIAKISQEEHVWTPHVEIITYSRPPRALWQGPQFELYEYRVEESEKLVSPSDCPRSSVTVKSIPIRIGGSGVPMVDDLHSHATRIECGSASQSAACALMISTDSQDEIARKVADAIREVEYSPPPEPQLNDGLELFYDTHSPTASRRAIGKENGRSVGHSAIRTPDELDFEMDSSEVEED